MLNHLSQCNIYILYVIMLIFNVTVICDFGVEPNLVACDWSNRNGSALRWELGAGSLSR
jgi:hypothetical protein